MPAMKKFSKTKKPMMKSMKPKKAKGMKVPKKGKT